jgi:poly-gamma-glutamate synthase PgsB/CapB
MGMRAFEIASVLAAGGCFAFLAAEAALLRRARRSLRLVVHVNGTRGKTATTRLIAAALREGGLRTRAKTTGTEPRLVLEDGTERPVRRWGAPNVREQRNVLLRAWRAGAEALVVECMAVSPDAQRASTAFLAPSVLVVTNSRPDHEAELGTPAEALAVFAEGIPEGGLVLTADASIHPELARAAQTRNATCLLAPPLEGLPGCHPENAGIALALAVLQGIPRETALRGMARHTPDPGAFAIRRLARPEGGAVTLVDALSANDPASTDQLFRQAEDRLPRPETRLLLLASRADRPDRALGFARWAAGQPRRWDGVLLAGPRMPGVARLLDSAWPGGVRRLRRVEDLALEADGCLVFAAGNWKGLGPALARLAP